MQHCLNQMQIVKLIISKGTLQRTRTAFIYRAFYPNHLSVFLSSLIHTSSGALWALDILQTGGVGNQIFIPLVSNKCKVYVYQ